MKINKEVRRLQMDRNVTNPRLKILYDKAYYAVQHKHDLTQATIDEAVKNLILHEFNMFRPKEVIEDGNN